MKNVIISKSILLVCSFLIVAGLTQCNKIDDTEGMLSKQDEFSESIYITLSVSSNETRNSVTDGGTGLLDFKWETNDKVYVYDGTKYCGVLDLRSGAGTDAACFGGTVDVTSGSTYLNFYHLGSSIQAPAAGNSVTADFSQQDGTLSWVQSHLVAYCTSPYSEGMTSFSGTFNIAFAVGKFSFRSTDFSSGDYIYVRGMNQKIVIAADGTMEVCAGEGSGSSQVNYTEGNAHYIALLSSNSSKTLTLSNKSNSCKTFTNPIYSNYFYRGKDGGSIPVYLSSYPGEGTLPGIFSVSDTKKVMFSQGNLWCDYNDTDNPVFHFEEKQYNYRTFLNLNALLDEKMGDKLTPDGHFGLFAWSTDNSLNPWGMTFLTAANIGGNFVDWGKNPIVEGGNVPDLWRTLTQAEWTYLKNHAVKSKQYTLTLEDGSTKVKGLLLFPDDFAGDAPGTTVTWDTWTTLESQGVVFIPATGQSGGAGSKTISNNNSSVYSQTSTWSSSTTAYKVIITSDSFTVKSDGRIDYLQSVRLVKDVTAGMPHYFENSTDYGEGININGTVWAPVNCGIGSGYENPYGKLYQFGRVEGEDKYNNTWTDGNGAHEAETFTQSSVEVTGLCTSPDDSKFYKSNNTPFDWYCTAEESQLPAWPLKSTDTGYSSGKIANPCPTGWRVPTSTELDNLRGGMTTASIVSDSRGTNGAYFDGTASPSSSTGVFLPAAGNRGHGTGDCYNRGTDGGYWSSDVDGIKGKEFNFKSTEATITSYQRAYGFSVRCVLDN